MAPMETIISSVRDEERGGEQYRRCGGIRRLQRTETLNTPELPLLLL
jgi:hypothetical protein